MCDLSESFLKNIIFTLCALLFILVLVFTLVLTTYYLFNFLKKDLKSTIVSAKFTHYDFKSVIRYSSSSKRKIMCFSEGQKFILGWYRPYYPNSESYKNMDEKSIVNTSCPGDTFYLILENKKVINVYNTKFFEIQE